MFLYGLGGINAQGWGKAEPSPKVNFIGIGSFPECEAEGVEDVKSYSTVATQESDAECNIDSIVTTFATLIANKINGEKAIISVSGLANSRYPDGGQT